MTAAELIELLKMAPDLEVMVNGYEGGVQPLLREHVLVARVKLNANERDRLDMFNRPTGDREVPDYYGPHEPDMNGDATVLVLSRMPLDD